MLGEDERWIGFDSPLTDRRSITPAPPIAGSAITLAAVDWGKPSAPNTITWGDFLQLLSATVGQFFSTDATIVQQPLPPAVATCTLQWKEIRRNGDFALLLANVLQVDNTYGARLVNWHDGTILQYEPDVSSARICFSDIAPISATFPILTEEPIADSDGFWMDVDADALAAMDATDREAETRYQSACERDLEDLSYDYD